MTTVRPLCPSCGSSGKIRTADFVIYVPCDAPGCPWVDRPPAPAPAPAPAVDYREPASGYDYVPVPPPSEPPAMPTIEEILAREPDQYITESFEALRANVRYTVVLTPKPGYAYCEPKSLTVWPPSPDLLIEHVRIGPVECLPPVGLESVVCWLSPLDMREAPVFGCMALNCPLEVQLFARNPIPRVVVILRPGAMLSSYPPNRNPYDRRTFP